jgi:hypothetical protein
MMRASVLVASSEGKEIEPAKEVLNYADSEIPAFDSVRSGTSFTVNSS